MKDTLKPKRLICFNVFIFDNKFFRVPYLEYPFPGIEKVNEYPSPRVIKTHVDVNKLPKAITEKGTKV